MYENTGMAIPGNQLAFLPPSMVSAAGWDEGGWVALSMTP